MTRIVLGAIALAALAFVMEVRRIAAGLDVTPEADEVVGMPTMLVHLREVQGNSWTMSTDDIARLWRPYVDLPTTRKDWRN